ncbi:type II toxin-antitoxin system death-on-curing family toxin [Rubritalea profundi]|uniref:Fido domain-containing protein n=1 Tax=Rubritalea profundi TaxID=1658618 RepID=A0A2S7TWX9_9BACT|nr:type II toxin-antitoxin system death-on-curing family toxin [Rubritalea profundi]PQJ27255.1 hypothetical protein BSZ32_01255 [Rubritalea profundi]
MEPEWLDRIVVDSFHYQQIREHGGAHGLRDEGLLELALNRPIQLWQYGDPKPDICAMAAAYAFGLAKNHPFFDGNKRTAVIACEVFLILNGYQFTIGEVEKYPHYLALASGEHSEESFLNWLREHTEKRMKHE